jgi:enoyl-CoA hydratase
MNLGLRAAIADALLAIDQNPQMLCAIIAANGSAFSAGADLNEMSTRTPNDARLEQGRRVWTTIEGFSKPIIAAVQGKAFGGGCELALACDIVIAARSASFALPEVKLGITPGAGGLVRLVRLAGRQRALRYVLTGQPFTAEIALALGIVSEVVDDGDVAEHAIAIASQIAAAAPLSVRTAKQIARIAPDTPIDAALEVERKAFQVLLASDDFREGVASFLEIREPRFKGS